jgi:hypothetical protein
VRKDKECKPKKLAYFLTYSCELGYTVVQLVEALSYKPADRGFISGWGRCDFFIDLIHMASLRSLGPSGFVTEMNKSDPCISGGR